MEYHSTIHHRRSIRLKGYDYLHHGVYYLTFRLHHRICSLGFVRNGKVDLLPTGKMVKKWWLKLPEKFSEVKLDVYAIMPEHFHGVIHIEKSHGGGGRFEPDIVSARRFLGMSRGLVKPLNFERSTQQWSGTPLSQIVEWFKMMTTHEYILEVEESGGLSRCHRLWQRGYYELVIRNPQELNRIRKYIIDNPLKWKLKVIGMRSKRRLDLDK